MATKTDPQGNPAEKSQRSFSAVIVTAILLIAGLWVYQKFDKANRAPQGDEYQQKNRALELKEAHQCLEQGVTLEKKHQEAAAEPLFRKAVDIRTKYFDQNNHRHIAALACLANCLTNQQKYDQAEQIAQKALPAASKTSDPMLSMILKDLGVCEQYDHKDFQKAEAYYLRALNSCKASPGWSVDDERSNILYSLADLSLDQGKYDRAADYSSECIKLEEGFMKPNAASMAKSRYQWGVALLHNHKYGDAESQFQQVRLIYDNDPNVSYLERAQVLWGIANCLYARKDYIAAKSVYKSALETLCRQPDFDYKTKAELKRCEALCDQHKEEAADPKTPEGGEPAIFLQGTVNSQ